MINLLLLKKFKQIFSSFAILIVFISFILGCGETNYILNEDTPPIELGFYGFRWTTPMSIVDEEFPNRTGAKPESISNKYNTANFKNAHFAGESVSLSKFNFNENGLNSVNLFFYTDYYSFEDKMYSLLEKLINIYGEPVEYFNTPEFHEIPEYIVSYSWNKKRLNLQLKTDYSIELNALSYIPYPIINRK